MFILILNGIYNPFYLSLSFFFLMEMVTIAIEYLGFRWFFNDKLKMSVLDSLIMIISLNALSALFAIPIWMGIGG